METVDDAQSDVVSRLLRTCYTVALSRRRGVLVLWSDDVLPRYICVGLTRPNAELSNGQPKADDAAQLPAAWVLVT